MQRASLANVNASLLQKQNCLSACPRRLGRASRQIYPGALAQLVLFAGSARAQTTTLIDTSLTIPVFAQTINFQVTSPGGAQFMVGSGVFNPADEGIGTPAADSRPAAPCAS